MDRQEKVTASRRRGETLTDRQMRTQPSHSRPGWVNLTNTHWHTHKHTHTGGEQVNPGAALPVERVGWKHWGYATSAGGFSFAGVCRFHPGCWGNIESFVWIKWADCDVVQSCVMALFALRLFLFKKSEQKQTKQKVAHISSPDCINFHTNSCAMVSTNRLSVIYAENKL